MSRRYFAYGSNMHLAQMRRRCPHSALIGMGLLPGYRWIITSRGYASVIPDPEAMVEGVLYLITAEDECRLDRYEGVAQGHYRKQVVRVLGHREEHRALVYRDPVEEEGKPKGAYVGRMNAAIGDAQLSPDYVKHVIRAFIPLH